MIRALVDERFKNNQLDRDTETSKLYIRFFQLFNNFVWRSFKEK